MTGTSSQMPWLIFEDLANWLHPTTTFVSEFGSHAQASAKWKTPTRSFKHSWATLLAAIPLIGRPKLETSFSVGLRKQNWLTRLTKAQRRPSARRRGTMQAVSG